MSAGMLGLAALSLLPVLGVCVALWVVVTVLRRRQVIGPDAPARNQRIAVRVMLVVVVALVVLAAVTR